MLVSAIVTAGGYGAFKGFGCKSGDGTYRDLPKVLFPLERGGRSCLRFVLDKILSTNLAHDFHVVTNEKYHKVIANSLRDFPRPITYSIQPHRLGSAGAVELALKNMEPTNRPVFINYGDMPLVEAETMVKMIDTHLRHTNPITTVTVPVLPGTAIERYGRSIFDKKGRYIGTIDDPNLVKPEDFQDVGVVNPSLYVFDSDWLRKSIPQIRPFDKGDGFPPEQLMQSLIGMAYNYGLSANRVMLHDPEQVLGVNTRKELRLVRSVHARRKQEMRIAA